MGNIVLLDDLTINKIAAGEVIERPASVIKEMVENSIDAGATNITVEIKNGGISYIRITDNGKGIPEDDMEMSFERHATSKIRSADDLNVVTSMGFRGEALASIAAIAKVEMVSKTENQQNGYKVVIEGGNILEKTEVGCPVGTSITVTNLFYNTPVRYKFLKKDFTESGYIEDVITRIGLVHPEISIKLINTGKTDIQTNGNGDLKTVIYSIYGKDVAGGIIETDYTYEGIHVYGVIGKPEIARSNRANQIFFVNKRYIKDKALSSAAEKAYKGMIPIGKFSFLVLNIEMNPSKVDVNVHPAKLEVRFEEENVVFKAVYHAIKDTLLKAELVANTDHTEVEKRTESVLFRKMPEIDALTIMNNNIENKPAIQKTEETKLVKQEETEKSLLENNEKVGTIIEQIYKARQQNISNISEAKNEKKLENKVNEIHPSSNIESSVINKSQEVLKKLQEMKAQLIKETPNVKLNEQENNEIRYEQPKEEEIEIQEQTQEYSINNENDKEQEQNITNQEDEELPKAIKEMQEENVDVETKGETKSDIEYTKEFEEMYLKMFGTKPQHDEQKQETIKDETEDIATLGNVSVFDNIAEYQKPTYKFIGIVFKTYIIIEMEKEMYIIDQHAAHERILYEKVKKNYYNEENKDSQLMLLPDIITLSHKEMEIAKENMEMFRKAGFMIEEFGENTIKLTGVPEMCLDLETKEMFLETLDEINSISRTAKQEIEDRFIATVACKAAVKANMALTKEEVDSLMNELLELPNPFTCPHGRPTAIKMSKYDIERKFARK